MTNFYVQPFRIQLGECITVERHEYESPQTVGKLGASPGGRRGASRRSVMSTLEDALTPVLCRMEMGRDALKNPDATGSPAR
jgi:hypothetical protein